LAPQSCRPSAKQEEPLTSFQVNGDNRPLAEFSLPALLASPTREPDNSCEELFKPTPFAFASLYRGDGKDNAGQATDMARLALAYRAGGVAKARPRVAQDLINQAEALHDSPMLEAARALVGLPAGKPLACNLKIQAALPARALIIARCLVAQGQLEKAKAY